MDEYMEEEKSRFVNTNETEIEKELEEYEDNIVEYKKNRH